MRYWLTTQWPHREGDKDRSHEGVFVVDGRERAGESLAPDDYVLIYEAQSGPTEIRQEVGQPPKQLPCYSGRGGIVSIVQTTTALQSRRVECERYDDGTEKLWSWFAATKPVTSNGFVDRKDVNRVLGYKGNYNFHGFGQGSSGLKEITATQFEELRVLFTQMAVFKQVAIKGEEPPPGRRFEGGGEGEVHRTLKEYVAAHPSLVLGEDGVTTLAVEYSFVTGDRADIALRDRFGRVIGVEVEVEQNDGQNDGTLQAIKYRYMLAMMLDVAFPESRSLLVAYKLSEAIRDRCARYDVQCVEVDRSKVERWDCQRRPKNLSATSSTLAPAPPAVP